MAASFSEPVGAGFWTPTTTTLPPGAASTSLPSLDSFANRNRTGSPPLKPRSRSEPSAV
jgi:hypothetical protein